MLTPEELSISPREHERLKEVLFDLEAGTYTFTSNLSLSRDKARTGLPVFSMATVWETYYPPHHAALFSPEEQQPASCGTVGCILGYARCSDHRNHTLFSSGDRSMQLHYLFYPGTTKGEYLEDLVGHELMWERITPSHAAAAIRNFLTRGSPRWEEVLKDLLQGEPA